MRFFLMQPVTKRRIATFAKQLDDYCAQMNGGLLEIALALAFLAATMFVVQSLDRAGQAPQTLPSPAARQP